MAGKRKWRENVRRAGLTLGALAYLRREAKRCGYCGRELGRIRHVDHILPVSQGGLTTLDNLIVVCADCNLSKADRTLHVWLETQPQRIQAIAYASVAELRAAG